MSGASELARRPFSKHTDRCRPLAQCTSCGHTLQTSGASKAAQSLCQLHMQPSPAIHSDRALSYSLASFTCSSHQPYIQTGRYLIPEPRWEDLSHLWQALAGRSGLQQGAGLLPVPVAAAAAVLPMASASRPASVHAILTQMRRHNPTAQVAQSNSHKMRCVVPPCCLLTAVPVRAMLNP